MISIFNNPYRILGLPVTASTRDINNRTSELDTFVEMGKTKSYETDFLFLSSLERSSETIYEASSMLEQSQHKFLYSLFWFWKNNSVDELAFDLMQDGKYEKAMSIWEKIFHGETISNNNFSSVKNLYTLYLGLSFSNGEINYNYLAKGILTAGYFFSNGFMSDFAHFVDGAESSINNDDFSISFTDEILDSIKPYLNSNNETDLKKIIESFQNFPDKTYQYSIKSFISEPIHSIKSNITKSKKKRGADPENAYHCGKELYADSISHLEYLENLLSDSDLTYQSIADNLAEEMLQCSIVFFNELRDSNSYDPGEEAFELAEEAINNIAQGDRVLDRIANTASVYLDWIDEKPERDKEKKIIKDSLYIRKQLDLLPDIESLESAKTNRLLLIAETLLKNCTPSLYAIRDNLGRADKLYLDISNEIVGHTMVMCIEYVNQTKKNADTLNVLKKILEFDMDSTLRRGLKENIEIIEQNIETWKKEKADEELYKKIGHHIENIKTQIEGIPDPESLTKEGLLLLPGIVNDLLNNCEKSLEQIKQVKGVLDQFYLNISSSVANNALGLCIVFINRVKIIAPVSGIIDRIDSLDMNKEARADFNKNKQILDDIKQASPINQIEDKGFCYIATMVYGDYNCPEVIELRRFRDDILSRHWLGKVLIHIYYKYSPLFVKKFNHSQSIKKIIKIFLQQLIKVV